MSLKVRREGSRMWSNTVAHVRKNNCIMRTKSGGASNKRYGGCISPGPLDPPRPSGSPRLLGFTWTPGSHRPSGPPQPQPPGSLEPQTPGFLSPLEPHRPLGSTRSPASPEPLDPLDCPQVPWTPKSPGPPSPLDPQASRPQAPGPQASLPQAPGPQASGPPGPWTPRPLDPQTPWIPRTPWTPGHPASPKVPLDLLWISLRWRRTSHSS